MFPDDNAAGEIIYAAIFGLSIFGNGSLFLYLIINKVKTSFDKILVNLAVVELLVVCLGIPYSTDAMMNVPYKNGEHGCHGVLPFHVLCGFGEALLLCFLAVYIAEKLKGDALVQKQTIVCIGLVYFASLIMVMPYFGVNKLTDVMFKGKSEKFCVEDWNIVALRIFRLMRVVFQFIVPLVLFVYYYLKSWRIVSFMLESVNSKKVSARYRSFSKVVADTADKSDPCYLKFTKSEEMNLQMNHIYKRENSISSIQTDDNTSNISVQIYTNEVTIEKISSDTPLWRGNKPDSKWKQENEYQKMVVSIKWFKYIRNLLKISFIVCVVYLIAVLPSQIMLIYSLFQSPTDYNEKMPLAAQIAFTLRFVPSLVNPWLFMFGVFKYRRSLCKCCKCC